MSNRLEALTATQARMVASSLEIDGRVSRAAEAVVGGHISEFLYAGNTNAPISTKAVALEGLKAEIEAEIVRIGRDALIAALRGPRRRAANPITEVAKDTSGLTAYSVQILCPTCEGTGRADIQACGRCSGAGHMWAKPGKPTKAEIAAADAQTAAENIEASRHRAEGEAIRDANEATLARRATKERNDAILTVEALPEADRRALGASLEIDGRTDLAASYTLNGTASLSAVTKGGIVYAATPEQERHARAVVDGLEAMIAADGLEATVAALRPRRPSPEEAFAREAAARASRDLVGIAEALPAARDLARDLATAEAEIDDDEPTEDRARVWDEAAAAYRRAFKLTVGWPLENPYEQPACGAETYRETRETPAEYCETPADECTEH